MERARLLLSGERLFHVVLGEHALYAALADPDVMEEQLRHLVEVSRLPRLRLGIMPTRARHYMTLCGFWIFDQREAQIETYSAAIKITQLSEIAMYAKVFEHYSRRAVYGQQATDLISQAIADLAKDLSRASSATSRNIVDPRSPVLPSMAMTSRSSACTALVYSQAPSTWSSISGLTRANARRNVDSSAGPRTAPSPASTAGRHRRPTGRSRRTTWTRQSPPRRRRRAVRRADTGSAPRGLVRRGHRTASIGPRIGQATPDITYNRG
jgi:Domain of unknown function (DUF5753)